MDTCIFNMLHYCRYKSINSIRNCISFSFNGIFKEFIEKQGPVG